MRDFPARWAGKAAHVFNDAKDRHLDLLHHPDAAPRDLEADILRCGDDNCPGQRKALRQRQLRVASARRQIEHQKIQCAPFDFQHEHLQVFRHHRTAQNGGFVVTRQHPHRDHLDAMRLRRDYFARRRQRGGLAGLDPQHPRHAGAIEIGVHQPDRRTLRRQGQGEVGADSAFTYTALAAGHGNDLAEARHATVIGRVGGCLCRRHEISFGSGPGKASFRPSLAAKLMHRRPKSAGASSAATQAQ